MMLVVALGKTRGMKQEQATELMHEALALPAVIEKILLDNTAIEKWADAFTDLSNTIFLGRGVLFPIALEGALKLKEISYIHADAYPAGELKHGPIALLNLASQWLQWPVWMVLKIKLNLTYRKC